MEQPIPREVAAALDAIRAGGTGAAFESPTLDFKEDPNRVRRTGGSRGNPDAKVVDMLLDASICFANGSAGDAHIVLGVADKQPGADAFTGTGYDPEWLEHRVFEGTVPQLRIEAREILHNGTRLVLIRVPEGLSVYSRTNGAARRRIGTSCEVLSNDERRDLLFSRSNPDFTARSSDLSIDELDPLALRHGRELLSARRAAVGDTTPVPAEPLVFLRELGLLTASGALTVAAVLMFDQPRPGKVIARHLQRRVPGGDPAVTEISGAIVLAAEQLQDIITRHADSEIARVDLGGGQEVAVPAFPVTAVDEIVANALVHRDWAMSSPVVVDQAPRLLKVWSPGPLPHGVDIHRILTVQSVPRNHRLMAGMRQLGLAEESSRGFDRMWRSMLATGREAPEIEAGEFSLTVTLIASKPDTEFIAALARLRDVFGADVVDTVTSLIVLRHLSRAPLMTARQVESMTHGAAAESRQVMSWLEDVGVVQSVNDRGDEWVLTSRARTCLGPALTTDVAAVSVQEWIEEHLRAGEWLTNREIVHATGADAREVTGLLSYLRQSGRLQKDPSGPSRGPGVRWGAAGIQPHR